MLDALHQFQTQELRRLPEEPGPNPIRGVRLNKCRLTARTNFKLPHQHIQTGFGWLRKCKRLSNTRTPSNTLSAARERHARRAQDTTRAPGRGPNRRAIHRATASLRRETHAPGSPQIAGHAVLLFLDGEEILPRALAQKLPGARFRSQRRSFDPEPEELPARTWTATYSVYLNLWSGRRESDPRPTAWKAVTLPLSYSRSTRYRADSIFPLSASGAFPNPGADDRD